jgi:hypothetical protein
MDISHPAEGVALTARRRRLPLNPLRIAPYPSPPDRVEAVVESYVRGSELVVHYAQLPGRTARPHICWRAVSWDEDEFALDVVVASQTDRWTSNPALAVQTWGTATEIYCGAKDMDGGWRRLTPGRATKFDAVDALGLFAFRLPDDGGTYVEMIHPQDFAAAELGREGNEFRLEYTFFDEVLEKGVIRKARIRVLMLAGSELGGALSRFREFAGAAPPLTA